MRKLNLNWIYLLAGVTSLIVAIIEFFKGDFVSFKLNLILCILFTNWYKDSVRESNKTYNISSRMDNGDLILTIERDKVRKN